MAKRLFVTGIAGFVGSRLARAALERGWSVRGMDIVPKGSATRLGGLPQEYQEEIDYRWQSLQDISSADLVGVDYAVHAAAVTDVPLALRSPVYTLQQNVLGTLAVMEAARGANALSKLIVQSSESVYGHAPAVPIPETSELRPSNIYGASKVGAEAVALAYYYSHGVPTVILRSSSLFGPGMRQSQVTPIFLSQAWKDEPITIHGDGSQTRDFNYVDNLVDGIVGALDKGRPGEVYNLAGGNEVSVLDLAQECIGVTASKSPIKHLPQRPGETGVRLVPDLVKAKQELGYAPRVSFEEGLRRTAYWVAETLDLSAERMSRAGMGYSIQPYAHSREAG